jgi:phage head maturation protease
LFFFPVGKKHPFFKGSLVVKTLNFNRRILQSVEKGREAIALIEAGAIDGLSIGYRTVKATKNTKGQRLLQELELWEVSLVTFPMLPSARVGAKADNFVRLDDVLREMARVFDAAAADITPASKQP